MKISQYLVIALIAAAFSACKQKAEQSVTVVTGYPSADTNHTGTAAFAKTVPAAQLIVPGKSIGQTAVNQSGSSVFANLGKPDMQDAAMGKSTAVWYAAHNKKSYSTHLYLSTDMGNDDTARVKVIRVTSPAFKTNNGLFTGVLMTDAQNKYKLTRLGSFKLNGSQRSLYDATDDGIAFDADRSGNITGIAVHQPRKSPINAYTAWFGEVMPNK